MVPDACLKARIANITVQEYGVDIAKTPVLTGQKLKEADNI